MALCLYLHMSGRKGACQNHALRFDLLFEKKINGCWEITDRSKDRDGYSLFSGLGEVRAHRYSYLRFKGPLIKGLTIDHLCRNRACVNPAHLEQVTMKVNLHRGFSKQAENARKTHCIRGHDLKLSPWNGRKRRCLACNRIRSRAYYNRDKREVTIND